MPLRTEEGPPKVLVDKAKYEKLLKASKFLDALKDAGVNNWDGYENANPVKIHNRSSQ